MPLDVAGFPMPSLADVLKRLHITPISRAVLDEHKKAEIKKLPAHWLAPVLRAYGATVGKLAGMAVVAIGLVVVDLFLDLMTHSWLMGIFWTPILSLVAAVALLVAICVLDGTRVSVKGKAYWHETKVSLHGLHCPVEITDIGSAIADEQLGVTFTFGTLIQNDVTHDPYLIVQDGDEEAVLGIWDDNGIIKIAGTARPTGNNVGLIDGP